MTMNKHFGKKYTFEISLGTGTSKIVKNSVTRKKLPNVYKTCPKMISLEKFPKNVRDLDKLIAAKSF